MHIGCSKPGSTALEDDCSCPQEACGLVDDGRIDPICPTHGGPTPNILAFHRADECPGKKPKKG